MRCNKLTVLILKPIEGFNLKKNQVEVEEDEDKIGKRQVLGALRENERRQTLVIPQALLDQSAVFIIIFLLYLQNILYFM